MFLTNHFGLIGALWDFEMLDRMKNTNGLQSLHFYMWPLTNLRKAFDRLKHLQMMRFDGCILITWDYCLKKSFVEQLCLSICCSICLMLWMFFYFHINWLAGLLFLFIDTRNFQGLDSTLKLDGSGTFGLPSKDDQTCWIPKWIIILIINTLW